MVVEMKVSPLSKRGSELSVLGRQVDQFKAIFGDLYDPDTNPDGFVNLGVSENVILPPQKAKSGKRKISTTVLLTSVTCSL